MGLLHRWARVARLDRLARLHPSDRLPRSDQRDPLDRLHPLAPLVRGVREVRVVRAVRLAQAGPRRQVLGLAPVRLARGLAAAPPGRCWPVAAASAARVPAKPGQSQSTEPRQGAPRQMRQWPRR